MVRSEGFEPSTTWFVARYSIQLSYERKLKQIKLKMVRSEGFEPSTTWFVARYSIQLSYERTKMAEREGFEPSMGFNAHTPLAGERLQPLGHLSNTAQIISQIK
jgi:hypothetical protein